MDTPQTRNYPSYYKRMDRSRRRPVFNLVSTDPLEYLFKTLGMKMGSPRQPETYRGARRNAKFNRT